MKNQNDSIKNYVVWIDKKKAVIGLFDESGAYNHSTLLSGIETRTRFPGEKSNKVRLITSKRTKETSEERRMDQELVLFCSKIVKQVQDASSLFIIGPSETKSVLKKILTGKKEFETIPVKVQNADKLTQAEIKTKAARHFKVKLRQTTSRPLTY